MIISLKIDVTKLEKARFFQGKNGAVYADLILNLKDDLSLDQYGNCGFMSQSVSKEERTAGKKMPICGNAKLLFAPKAVEAPKAEPATPPKNDFSDDDSSIPF